MKTYTKEEVDEIDRKYKEKLIADRKNGITHEWLYLWISYFPDESINLTMDEIRSLVWAYDSVVESYESEIRHASDY